MQHEHMLEWNHNPSPPGSTRIHSTQPSAMSNFILDATPIGESRIRSLVLFLSIDSFRSPAMIARTMKALLSLCTVLASVLLARAEMQTPVPLWPGGAPGALGKEDKDIPTLTPYLPEPDKASGAAIVVCPGGGYGGLAAHEGNDYALYLNQQGVTAFVLKYRLGSHGYRHPSMLQDDSRAT